MNYLLLSETSNNQIENIWNNIINWCTTTGLQFLTKIVVALLIWWISFKIINAVFRKIEKKMANKDVDRTIKETLISFSRKGLKILVVICIISYLGVEMSSIVALITSIGVTVGLALQGSLSNFAGGVIILIMRPFRLGDFVEYDGVSGTVEKIQLFYTTIVTGDNKVIVIPNSKSGSSTIINYSIKKERRLDLTFSIAYENDFRKAKRIINKFIENNDQILKDKGYTVRINQHNASSIDIVCRVWVNASDYGEVRFDMLEQIKLEFDANGVSIPYNQLDVHIKKDEDMPKPIDLEDKLVQEEIKIEAEQEENEIKNRKQKIEEKAKKEKEANKKVSTKIKKLMSVK